MDFSYGLTGPGWSAAEISDSASTATLTASYLSDALGDLLDAVVRLLEGAVQARCSWEEEPGEYRWLFVRQGEDVHLRILWFDDLWTSRPDDPGEPVFATTQPLTGFAAVVGAAAAQVLAEHGEEGYLECWMDAPFPTAALMQIRDVLLVG